jgi:hypothetical protein
MTRHLARAMALLGGVLLLGGCGRSSTSSLATADKADVREMPLLPPVARHVQAATAKSGPKHGGAEIVSTPSTKVGVRLHPGEATLEPGDSGLQLTVEGPGSHGGLRDLSSQAAWESDPVGIVVVEAGGYLRPMSAGQATVRVTLPGELGTATMLVKVGSPAERAWDFAEDIVPILTRQGCNTGSCHGKADGQNGFHLSLFGYDPEGDLQALTRDAAGRRLSIFNPDQSLLLLKATGRTSHAGGQRLLAGSDEYRTLRDWMAAGAPLRQGRNHGALAKVTVEPADVRLDEPGAQQLRVVARYADGHERDVTRLANFRVNDDSTASIDANGKAVLLRRAETDLVVRYRSKVVSTRLATLINPDLSFDFAALPRRNFIDDELFKRLESLRVPPSPAASDTAFLRRVSLDLTGEQPTPAEIREYLADTDPDKRTKLVDRLLVSKDFVKFWRIKLGDMLQISNTRFGNGAEYYESWLATQLRENAPWDQSVNALLTALGDPLDKYKGGPVNYALDGPDPKVKSEQFAQRFLGLRLRCAQCHDHPFDVWTQDDYFGLAAIFAKVEPTGGGPGGMGKAIVKVNPKARLEHLRTKRPAEPRLLSGEAVKVPETDDPRKVLAAWVTSPENPYFARAMANWTWAQFFGKGIADPPDDLSMSNPPVHPELLDALAAHFVAHHYDVRDLIRTIATSQAYGLSSATTPGNEHDTRLFSHHQPRPLTAHQMADALAQATDVENRYLNRAKGTKAIDVYDPTVRSTILETFGRCPRTNGCAAVSTPPLSLRQSLLLIGGDVIESKITSLSGYLADLISGPSPPEPADIVENLYLRTVCRKPTAGELDHWTSELKKASSFREAAEDLFWALLNSREFAFNH